MGELGKDWLRGVGVTVPVTGSGGNNQAWPLCWPLVNCLCMARGGGRQLICMFCMCMPPLPCPSVPLPLAQQDRELTDADYDLLLAMDAHGQQSLQAYLAKCLPEGPPVPAPDATCVLCSLALAAAGGPSKALPCGHFAHGVRGKRSEVARFRLWKCVCAFARGR
jgi:hypothetical protein